LNGSVNPPVFEGSYKGKPTNWRKMALKRPFTVAEMKLLDSEWDFQHAGGSFAVEFRATISEDLIQGLNCLPQVSRTFTLEHGWQQSVHQLGVVWGVRTGGGILKIPCIVTLDNGYVRTLTFENLCGA
jgi:hypothetical protein